MLTNLFSKKQGNKDVEFIEKPPFVPIELRLGTVGEPGIGPGPHHPQRRILPLYYSP